MSTERSLLFIHVINLGDDMPGAIVLGERVEVRIVGADRVILHVYANHRRRRCDSENIEPRLTSRRGAFLLDKVIEVFDWATEHLAICEAVHHGVLVEGLGEAGNTLNSHYIIYSRNNNYSSV